MPVTDLLARKLELLAELPNPKFSFKSGELLMEHARSIELMQQRVKGLEVAVSERDGQIGNLILKKHAQFIETMQQRVKGLEVDVVERDGQIGNLNQAVAKRDKVLRKILFSKSWRITRPLRTVRSFFSTRSNVVLVALRRSGGIRPAISKAVSVFKREGWKGLVRRVSSDRNDYSEWILCYDTLTDEARATMRAHTASYSHKPLISVLMPTYNSKPEWLIEAVESVLRQVYPYWELCIADDASSDKTVRPILERYAQKDPRIKVVFREQNGHISAASNSALGVATGEWVALLDHDDLLSEHALFWVADAINRDPTSRLIYSDEDKIDGAGRRFAPYFKCDWNVDLFYSQNLFSHLGVYPADLLREIGGFRQ